MPNPWNERSWEEQRQIEEASVPRDRNTDSSVSAQYEDLTPPDHTRDHDDES